MDLHPWKLTGSTWTKEKVKTKESTKEEKAKEENGLQPGAIYVAKVGDVASKAREKTKESRRERKVSTRLSRVSKINGSNNLTKKDMLKHNFLEDNVDHAVLQQQVRATQQ